jgi:hypothetical protein
VRGTRRTARRRKLGLGTLRSGLKRLDTFFFSFTAVPRRTCLILAAMTRYERPARSPYQKPFRIVVGVAIVLLAVILYLALNTPEWMSDLQRKLLVWAAGAIVVVYSDLRRLVLGCVRARHLSLLTGMK